MEERISFEKIKNYSSVFTITVVSNFFRDKSRISGKEILQFLPVQQVNLFILSDLMRQWVADTSKLQSPYFDYSAQPVQDALQAFMNVLSNHISIARKDFEPLIEKAIRDTIFLILSPYDFYSNILETNNQGFIKVSDIKSQIRYLRINKAPLEKLLQKLIEEKKESKIAGKEVFAMLDQILEEVNFSPEDPEIYLDEFSKILPVQLKDFFENVKVQPPRKQDILLNRSQKSVQTTLYDEIGKDSRPTLADNFQKIKIGHLKDHLTINQKFMFTKILFNGDFELFSQAIDRIDLMDTLDQATRYIENNFPEWNQESEEYEDFKFLLEKRFS